MLRKSHHSYRLPAIASACLLALWLPSAEAWSGFLYPVTGRVTGLVGEDRGDHLHAGLDIAASSGTPIYAACQGTVIHAGWYSGYGNTIDILHAGNWVTRYAHQSAFAVGNGTVVVRGQHIGYVGSTGDSTGPHVHFEIRQGQTYGYANVAYIPGSRNQWITAGTEIPANYSGSSCSPPLPAWDATYHNQSYPSSMVAGTTAVAWAEFVNRGSSGWHHCETRLGTAGPQDRSSPFCNVPNWSCANLSNPGCHRPTDVDQSEVSTNNVGRFTFILKAPTTPGVYVEKFRLVREGVTWFGPEITWTISVTAANGNLTGTVTNAATSSPIANATVSLAGVGSTTTNGSGAYTFNAVTSGSYGVTVSATGFNGASANVSITAGQTTTQNFALTATDTQPPSIPTGLAGQALSATSVALTWNASTDNLGVAGYDIRRDGTVIGSSAGTNYTDNSATPATEHSYEVRARDSVPNYSDWCPAISVLTPFAPPQTTLVFADGFNGNLNQWTQQTQGYVYSTAVSHNGYAGGGAAFSSAGEADQMFHGFARPFAQGRGWAHFWDGKGGWKPSVCGWAYRQTFSLRSGDGAANMFIDNELYSAADNSRYFFRSIGVGGIGHTPYATRNPNTDCNGAWVYFEIAVTPAAVGASPTGTFTAKVVDGAGTTSTTQNLTEDFYNFGIGRITLGLGVSSTNECYWDDIGFEAKAPAVPTLTAATPLSETQIRWEFTAADQNHFGFDLADEAGTILAPQWPNEGWLARQSTSWTESGLAPNTGYVRKLRAWNGTLNSSFGWSLAGRTLSPPPGAESVSPSTTTPCAGSEVVWTAAGGFGEGKVEYYRYQWDQNPTHSFDGSEPVWAGGVLALPANQHGPWYLHLQGCNADDVPNGSFVYPVEVLSCAAPAVTAAVSERVHGAAGVHAIDLLAEGSLECRTGGPTRIVVTFDADVQGLDGLDSSDVELSSGTVSSLTLNGAELTINLSGVTNTDVLNISFPGVASASNTVATVTDALCLEVLAGDINNDRLVNVFDMVAVRNALNQPVTASNFQADVTASGAIDIFDLTSVRNHVGLIAAAVCP